VALARGEWLLIVSASTVLFALAAQPAVAS
jgi:hypothetical protein